MSSMQPRVPVLAQSENKSKFLERLGLDDESEKSKMLYTMMKEEAVAGRARITADPNSLLPDLKNDPKVRPPYSVTQISDLAMHRETLYIYRNARPETKAQYDRGHYIEGGKEENWIIKWSLWHVFRYRDNRNRGRVAPNQTQRDQRDNHGSSTSTGQTRSSISDGAGAPLHECTLQRSNSNEHLTASPFSRRERQDSAHAHYDPVRDVFRRS